MKYRLFIVIITVLFIGTAGSLTIAADIQTNEPRVQNQSTVLVQPVKVDNGIVRGGILGVLQFKRSPEADADLMPGRLKDSGWVRTATNYQKTVVMSEWLVGVDDGPAQKVSADGQFRLSVPLGVHFIRVYDQEGHKVTNREVALDKKGADEILPIVIVNDLEDHSCCALQVEPMEAHVDSPDKVDEIRDEPDAHTYASGPPPCLDYNGPLGNCINYSDGWRKYRNFILSECDSAMAHGYCWNELMPGVSCNHSGKNCAHISGFNHSQYHHCH